MPTPAVSDPHLNGFILQGLQCGKMLLDRALEICRNLPPSEWTEWCTGPLKGSRKTGQSCYGMPPGPVVEIFL